MRLHRPLVEAEWQATICSAGHPLPLLIRGDDVVPVGKYGPLIGVFPTGHRQEEILTLAPGEALVLFTDGVTEARQGGQFYEDERLRHVLARSGPGPAKAIVDELLTDVLRFEEDAPRDDIAIVAISVPSHPPRPAS
jgi:sigma-B regulation protein RsbU (phosphoserine phosphatase)